MNARVPLYDHVLGVTATELFIAERARDGGVCEQDDIPARVYHEYVARAEVYHAKRGRKAPEAAHEILHEALEALPDDEAEQIVAYFRQAAESPLLEAQLLVSVGPAWFHASRQAVANELNGKIETYEPEELRAIGAL